MHSYFDNIEFTKKSSLIQDDTVRYVSGGDPPSPPPADSKFTPPAEDEIRTIYVPLENAINIPQVRAIKNLKSS